MAKGLLLVGFDYANAHEDEFHDWYDLEHIPERARIPGFGACNRWIGTTNRKHAVATYELDNLDVLQSAPYRAIAGENLSVWSKRVTAMCQRLIRFDGEQILPGEQAAPSGAGGLLVNAMNVDPAHEAEFNEWYDHEHIPALAAVPGNAVCTAFPGQHRIAPISGAVSSRITRRAADGCMEEGRGHALDRRLRPHFRDHLRILARHYVRAK